MIIGFNTDKNTAGSNGFRDSVSELISEELERFSAHITRLDVHITDEDGKKDGKNDKRCLLEARLEGRKPIAVTHHANNNEQAVEGAIEKMKSSLETIIGHLRNH